jgi:predicted DNA-binding transcriptional regulator YafY
VIMAKKKASSGTTAVSLERAARLYRMITFLGQGPQTRTALTRRLRLGVRGYYRDLEILRAVGIVIELADGRYYLRDNYAAALDRLPFADPGLNLGEARQLSRGRSGAHKKIREQLQRIEK